MKRIAALLSALLLILTALAACGGSKDQNSAAGNVTIEEATVLNEKGYVAVVKSLGKYDSDILKYELALVFEVTDNTDKPVSFTVYDLSVNGCMLQGGIGVNVEPGKSDNLPVPIDESQLKKYGIDTIADLEFCFRVEDAESFETQTETDPIIVKTSAYEGFEYKYDESGTVLYDSDGIKLIARDGLIDSDIFGQYVDLYVDNQTDKKIDVMVEDGLVNGKEAEISVGTEIPAGKRSLQILSVDEEDRPDKINSLTLSFSILDNDSGKAIVEKTEPVTLTY